MWIIRPAPLLRQHAAQRGIQTFVYTLEAYTLQAYSQRMIFVELTPFVRFREEHWSDEDLRALQQFLLISPDAGDVIRGTHGLRKLRWSVPGRGKRGGARVIYYWQVRGSRIYLIYAYLKNESDDLTPQQLRMLAELMKDMRDG